MIGVGAPSVSALKLAAYATALLVLMAGTALLLATLHLGPAAYRGNVLEPPLETVSFRLTNQDGAIVDWSDYRGKVVALTFLYTACTDVCPLTTAKLRKAHELLGEDAERVAFVAITVDPVVDTVAEVYRYSKERDMLGKWTFLVGSEGELRPLWEAYWAGPLRSKAEGAGGAPNDHEQDEETIEHGAPVHLIDAEGQGRVVFSEAFQPVELVEDVRTLLQRG